jgi:hypothetical protein
MKSNITEAAEQLIFSKKRVADHGEVLTPEKTYPPMNVRQLAEQADMDERKLR